MKLQSKSVNLVLILCPFVWVDLTHSQTLIENDFDRSEALESWRSFRATTKPGVSIYRNTLLGQTSSFAGLTALSKDFDKPQSRISVEFSLAFSHTPKRTFHIWSHEPEGKDASQLNLCIQNGSLQHFDGRVKKWRILTDKIRSSPSKDEPIWHRIKVIADRSKNGIAVFVSRPGQLKLPEKPIVVAASYRNNIPLAGISFVSGTRIAKGAWYRVEDLKVTGGEEFVPSPGTAPELPTTFHLWTGKPIPADPKDIPWVNNVKHSTIHEPGKEDPKFLHGAAIIHHKGVLYSHWANSPTNENGPHETLRGKSSLDDGKTWSELKTFAPGFKGLERHSHGVLFSHQGKLWTICSRFGVGVVGRRFDGLMGEAFVLDQENDRWLSKGIVMIDCWPYDQPVQLKNGNFVTGGQNRDGFPVVAISDGDNILKWRSILIPFPPDLEPGFAETTVWADDNNVVAIIRGGGGVAWISHSKDGGESWTNARPTNMPMPRAKAYLGKLSTGQFYLISNYRNRDTLCISVSKPGEKTLSQIFRLRDGKSYAPRFPGKAKSRQWSYPYAYEHQGKLYVVYSVGKEECGLSIVPIDSLKTNESLE